MNNMLVGCGSVGRLMLAAAVLVGLTAADVAAQLSGVRVAFVDGQVDVYRYGSRVPTPAEVGMTLSPGDEVFARKGKIQINVTTSGILRLSKGSRLLLPTREVTREEKGEGLGVLGALKVVLVDRPADRLKQAWVDPDNVFDVPSEPFTPGYDPPSPEYQAEVAKQDAERIAEQRERREAALRVGEDPILAEYRALLPAVIQKEKKPWHTRFDFFSIAVKEGNGWRVRYKTYCLIDTGPDTGKDYVCYEFDSVLDLGEIRKAVPDMKRRLGR